MRFRKILVPTEERATLLGSVAEAMIRKSPCPVLVVRTTRSNRLRYESAALFCEHIAHVRRCRYCGIHLLSDSPLRDAAGGSGVCRNVRVGGPRRRGDAQLREDFQVRRRTGSFGSYGRRRVARLLCALHAPELHGPVRCRSAPDHLCMPQRAV